MHASKPKKLTQSGFDHVLLPLACFVVFALIGSFYLYHSLAATSVQWKGVLEDYRLSSGYCLTTTGSTKASLVELDPCSKTYDSKQVWSLVDVRKATVSNESNVQEFYLQSADGGECIDNWGASKKTSYPEKLYPCSTTDSAVTWIWGAKFTSRGYSSHQLSNMAAASMCLDDRDGSDKSGTYVGLYTCKTTAQSNQEWFEQGAPSSSGSGSGSGSGSSTSGGCTSGGAVAPCIGSATTGASGWKLAFDDEFNGTSLNTSVWNPNGWTNNNMSSGSSASYVSESGGDLILKASSGSTGAQVETSSTADALKVGDVAEARVEFKGPGSGPGTSIYNWPAWWVSGPDWPAAGESDIAESYNGSLTVNYHSPAGADNGPQMSQKMSNAFHTYTIERFSNKCEVWWDGQLVRTYSTDDNGQPENLIFTNGVGNTSQTGVAGEMLVDYVRVWSPS